MADRAAGRYGVPPVLKALPTSPARTLQSLSRAALNVESVGICNQNLRRSNAEPFVASTASVIFLLRARMVGAVVAPISTRFCSIMIYPQKSICSLQGDAKYAAASLMGPNMRGIPAISGRRGGSHITAPD